MKAGVIFKITLMLAISATLIYGQNLKNLKKRVAVMDFEDKARYGHNIGSGLADMLLKVKSLL